MKNLFLLIILMFATSSMVWAQNPDTTQLSKGKIVTFDSTYIFEYYMLQDRAYFTLGDVNNFIDSNLVLPDDATRSIVMVDFVIEPDSSFSKVIAYTPNDRFPLKASHQKAALEVVKQMEGYWEPAHIDNRKVRMRMTLPVRFKPSNQ